MKESLLCRDAFIWIECKHLVKEVESFWASLKATWVVVGVGAKEGGQLTLAFTLEGYF